MNFSSVRFVNQSKKLQYFFHLDSNFVSFLKKRNANLEILQIPVKQSCLEESVCEPDSRNV